MGPAEPDGGVRPQVHFQVHLLGLDHFPVDREDATPGPQCGGLDLGQVDGQHPPDEEGGGALPGEPGHPQAAQQGGIYIFKEMGTFLAAKNFIVNCPLPVMEIPVAPVHDGKEALRFRAVCDERITLPLASLKAFDSVYTSCVIPRTSSGSWVAPPPWVPLAPGEERPRRRTPRPRFWGGRHGRGPEVHQAFPQGDEACVLGLRGVWLGLAQHGSGGQGEVQDHRGLYVQIFARASGGRAAGTRLLHITGWHKDKATCLQLVMDEPPEQLYNQWIRDRMEFYKRVEPTEPPRDNKRQSRRLKAGQQALAGLTLGSLPVSASDRTLSPEPWARHCMEISDRPTTLPITHDPNLSDKVMYLQMAFKQRPLRDGGGKPSLGRLAHLATVQSSSDGGQDLCPHFAMGGQAPKFALVGGRGTSLPEGPAGGYREILAPGAGRPAEGQPFFLDILRSVFPRDLEQGVPLRVTDPPLASPGIWPLKSELTGEEPEFQELSQ